jgi:hypothetical protein
MSYYGEQPDMWHQPPLPPQQSNRRKRTWMVVGVAAVVAGIVAVLVATGLFHDNTSTGAAHSSSAPSKPVVAFHVPKAKPPQDFRNRLVLQRSIHETMVAKAARILPGDRVGKVGCIDIGVRHWECNVSLYNPITGEDALTLDVRVSSDYQRWVSDSAD